MRSLANYGYTHVITTTRQELDLRDQVAVNAWFARYRPQYVFVAAGTVGGILANMSRPAEFLYDNLLIHGNVVHAAYSTGVTKLLYLGSSCMYPRDAAQPVNEKVLLTGPLESTNEPYAIAKIAGVKLCQAYRKQYGCDFISAVPTNVYGPNDNFDLSSSHVVPALIRKFHDAKTSGASTVTVWGSGTPRRELLHVDDLADACVFLMRAYSDVLHVNVGTGTDIAIRDLAELVREIVYPAARIEFDTSKPDGIPRKLLNVDRLHALGWRHRTDLRQGLAATYSWFLEQLGATSAARSGASRRAT